MNSLHPAILPDTPMRPHSSSVTLPRWALAVQLAIILIALSTALGTTLLAIHPSSPNPPPRPLTGLTPRSHPASHPRFQLI
jgi:hypothetical protein